MAISTQTQNLNLIPGKSAPVVVHLSQGNVGDNIKFNLYDGTEKYYPYGVSITVNGMRRDETFFGPIPVTFTQGSNVVSFAVTSAMTAYSGGVIAELTITDTGGNTVGTANFAMLIEEGTFPDGPIYETDASIYQNILEYVQTYTARIDNLMDKIENIAVSPMDYGAVGDGETDDSDAVAAAAANGVIRDEFHTFKIEKITTLPYGSVNTKYFLNGDAAIISNGDMIGNEFSRSDSGEGRGQFALVIRNAKQPIDIRGNEFHSMVSALWVEDSTGVIHDNYFHDIEQSAAGTGGNGYGIVLVECDGLEVCNNLFKNVARHSVYISFDSRSGVLTKRNRNINIHDNTFEWDENVEGATTGFETTIMIRPAVNVTIHHNRFVGIQSVFTTEQAVTGESEDYIGVENLQVDNNYIISPRNTARPTDGVFTFLKKTNEDGAFTTTGCIISNNVIEDSPLPFARIGSVKDLEILNNVYRTTGTALYVFQMVDLTANNHPVNMSVCGNDFGEVTGQAFRFGGEGHAFGKFKVCDNIIRAGLLIELFTGQTFTEFTFRNNTLIMNATYTTIYTRSAALGKVDIFGNTCNVKYNWSVTFNNEDVYNYDNTFSPLADGTYANLKRGTVLALSNNTIKVVAHNGTLVQV